MDTPQDCVYSQITRIKCLLTSNGHMRWFDGSTWMRFAAAIQRLLREAGLRLGLLMLEVGLIGLCTLANIRLDETVMGVAFF